MLMQTIYVVDDNLDLCRLMVALLKHMGYAGKYATSGETALQMIEGAPPDLLILDVMMPEMDGMEMLRRLKAKEQTQQIPVVMFSAVTDPEFRNHAIAKGACDYWIKSGVDFKDMQSRITKILPKA